MSSSMSRATPLVEPRFHGRKREHHPEGRERRGGLCSSFGMAAWRPWKATLPRDHGRRNPTPFSRWRGSFRFPGTGQPGHVDMTDPPARDLDPTILGYYGTAPEESRLEHDAFRLEWARARELIQTSRSATARGGSGRRRRRGCVRVLAGRTRVRGASHRRRATTHRRGAPSRLECDAPPGFLPRRGRARFPLPMRPWTACSCSALCTTWSTRPTDGPRWAGEALAC